MTSEVSSKMRELAGRPLTGTYLYSLSSTRIVELASGQSDCHCHYKLYCLLYVMLLNTVVVLCHILTMPYGLVCL